MSRVQDAPPFPLGPALDFLRRLWRLDQALERLSSHMEQRLGITAQQRLIVRCVGQFPGMTAGQLAGLLHVDPGTISAALRRLEAKDLVARRKDPRDSRRVALGLTARGRALDVPTPDTVEDAAEELLATTQTRDLENAISLIERFTALLQSRSGRATPRQPHSGSPGSAVAQRRRRPTANRPRDTTGGHRSPAGAVNRRGTGS